MNALLPKIALNRLASIPLLAALALAQDRPTFRVKVDMVVLSFQVTDNKGHYVNGLKPKDFRILEDGIRAEAVDLRRRSQAPRAGGRGRHHAAPSRRRSKPQTTGRAAVPDAFVGTNVFVLFDTSNYMYRGFVYASDAIADFVRGLDRADSVAVYTYSRNLSRAAPLSHERTEAIFGLRKAVAGDDSALYNCLLLTLRDAAKVPGRKVVIVFSNGPDNASMVAPNDVQAVAEDEGIPIYVISTNEVNKDPISSQRLQAHFARAPAENRISPRPGRSRWRRSKTSAKIWATPTPSPIIRSPIRTKDSARSAWSCCRIQARSTASSAVRGIGRGAGFSVL